MSGGMPQLPIADSLDARHLRYVFVAALCKMKSCRETEDTSSYDCNGFAVLQLLLFSFSSRGSLHIVVFVLRELVLPSLLQFRGQLSFQHVHNSVAKNAEEFPSMGGSTCDESKLLDGRMFVHQEI